MNCAIIPQVKNKQGELVDSKLFKDLLSISENREEAKTRYLQTRTNEFKAWFGDWENFPEQSSKIVDENGEPLIVYHGTNKDFNKFSTYISYFTDSYDYARGVKREITDVMPTYLNIKNPKIYSNGIKIADIGTKELADKLSSSIISPVHARFNEEIFNGADGMIGKDLGAKVLSVNSEDPTTYVTFYPNQIKSIANTRGFSKTNDNIYYQQQSDYKANSKELDEKVSSFLKTIGVDIKTVKNITDADGNKLDANAVANLLTKTIDVVEDNSKLDTLPEEASHFLVEILKQNNSPLYKSMLSEIEGYDIYKQTIQEYNKVYAGNESKIKDEAMAKVIASQIVDNFQQENKKGRVATWFNRVISFIKEKLGLIDKNELHDAIIKDNPFGEAASLIYDRRGATNFKFEEYSSDLGNEENQRFFQLRTPRDIEEKIRTRYDISGGEDGGRYTRLVDGKQVEVKNRISDKSKQADVTNLSQNERTRREIEKITGQKGHKDLDNILQRVIAERDGKLSPARKVRTDENTYNTLERYVRQMVKDLPSDSRILTNTPIYSSKGDIASTPSMMIVNANGKVDLYKWLFTTLTKDDRVNKNSENEATKTLQEQKKILAEGYGITNFGKIRTIPIQTRFDDGFLSSIKTGSQTFESSPELDPIPVSEELTGDEKLDRVISTLLVRRTRLENSKLSSSSTPKEKVEFNERKYAELNKINKAIRDIQLKQDVKEFVGIGLSAINELANTPVNQYSEERLLDLQKTMQFYGKDMLNLIAGQVKDFSEIDKAELNRLVTESQLYDTNIEQEVARRLLSITGRSDLNDARQQTGVYERMFRTISQQQNPIIQSFWSLVQGAKTKTRESVLDLNSRVKEAVDELRKAQPGIESGKLFDFMLRKSEDGKLSVIPKYDGEFYKKLKAAREDTKEPNNLAFIKRHTTFDQEAYDKAYSELEKVVVYQYRNDVDKDEKISDRLKSFQAKYRDVPSGYTNPKNYFVKLNEDSQLYSKEYKNIQSKKELKNFYDLWMKESKNFQDYIGKDLGGRFVWNVHNGLIDSFRENGFGAFTNMTSVLDHLEAKAGETLGMIDPETGKPLYELPSYYTDSFDIKNQSKDLGKVLSLVGAMAYNHQYMGDIESTSKMLEIALQNQQEIQTDNNGNPIKNKLTNAIAKAVGSANTIDQMRDYMNYYLYGVRNKTKDFTVKIGDRNISTLASINLIRNWFVGKSLSFNPVSIVAHGLRGETNVRIIGAMGKYFSNSEYTKAMGKLVTRDSKFFSLAGYFDLMDGENYHKKAETLSASKLSQHITYDHMFIGHRATDYTVKNGILGAMLLSHTYDGNKIVKIRAEDKTSKSLFDLIQIKNDKLDFGDIPKDILDGFRNKVHTVGDRVFGMNTRDDMKLAQLNVLTRALMTFRNWIPGMVDTRYRELTHNEDLDTYELGRYRTFWNNVVNKQVLPLLWDGIKGFGVFGYGGKFGDVTINHAKDLYAKYMDANPNAKITESEYVDLHLANMRGNMAEIYITLAMVGAVMAVKKEEGETLAQGSLRKYMSKQINRALADISFFYNPAEFNSIIKSPIPIVESYLQPLHLLQTMWHGGETVLGIPHKEKEGELRKAAFQAVPGLNGFESLLSFIQDDYDKTKTVGTDSGSK